MYKINQYELANGIKLISNFDATTQMVALNFLYDVGSKDEEPGKTGMAHLLEHLMFTGSGNVAIYDEELQRAGGVSNAWTSQDVTNYYDVLPAQNIETALWIESDRLLDLTLSDASVETQKSVVIEEFKQRCLNVPYGDLPHLTNALAYKTHPYSWPAIGRSVGEIKRFTTADVRKFYEKHYSADRLTVCISGNCSFDKAVELTEKWFGDIRPRQCEKRKIAAEPEQKAVRLLREKNDNVPHNVIARAYHMCGRADKDYYATDLLSDVLANGQSSRFFQHLVLGTRKFTNADASITGTFEPGLFLIRASLAEGVTFDEASALIDEELAKVVGGDVSDYEVQKCANKCVATDILDNSDYKSVAEKQCTYSLLGDVELINKEHDRYFAVTKQMIEATARRVLQQENCSTLLYGPDA